MNKKFLVYVLVILIIITGCFVWASTLKAQEKGKGQTIDISGQLQQIIQNQQIILTKLNDIKEELRIIKIRSTVKR